MHVEPKRAQHSGIRGNSLKTEEKTVDVDATFEQEGPNPYNHSKWEATNDTSAPTGSVSHRVVG